MANDSQECIKTFLIGEDFDAPLLEKFLVFHNKVVADSDTEAIIYINSFGGNMDVLSSIISLIQSTDVIYHTVNIGCCCSAACLLAGLGTIRWASSISTYLFHDYLVTMNGNKKQIMENMQWNDEFAKKMFDVFSKRTNKNLSWWLENAYNKKTHNFCFDAKKAIEFGVADIIGLPKVKNQLNSYIEYPSGFLNKFQKKIKSEKIK